MQKKNPFYIIPWNNNFISELYTLIDKLTNSCPSKAVVIFSNDRPKRYLIDIYKNTSNRPVILPNIITLEQLIGIFMKSWEQEIPRTATLLDQISLLKETILDTAESLPSESSIGTISKRLQEEDGMSFFYPWGTHLAALLEECARQGVEARDLLYVSDLVMPPAAAILGSLKLIQEIFRKKLEERGLSTPGRNLRRISLQATDDTELPAMLQDKIIIVAGFLKLNKSENMLFNYLWSKGAYICLDTDPKIFEGEAHWCCRDHAEWIKKWHSDILLYGEVRNESPKLHFFSAYSLHSQLIELKKKIEEIENKETERSAVVLCHDELLMPTLHHIEEKQINISLGYPLSRTLLFRLIEQIFEMALNKKNERISVKSFKEILRHPYIRELGIYNDNNEVTSLKGLLLQFEKKIKLEGSYLIPTEFAYNFIEECKTDGQCFSKEQTELLINCINVLSVNWDRVDTLESLAEVLGNTVYFLLTYDRHIWKRFPLDLECLSILTEKIIPQLAENAMSRDKLSQETLFSIAKEFLSEQRIPFNADPLTGLQVMGTLETRHLHFDNVYFLDLTEDAVPGKQQYDPLMPENLRFELGLSDTKHKDYIAAYSFYRMIAGAKNVYLFWQEGSGGGLFDEKKSKSRFIEEELWKIEQDQGKIIKKGEAPLISAFVPPISPILAEAKPILRTDEINRRLLMRLTGNNKLISGTFLDSYIHCPVQFFHGTLCGISKNDDWDDSEDYLGLGNLLHDTLKEAYTPFLGKEIRKGDISTDQINDVYKQKFREIEKNFNITPGSRYYLESAVPYKIRQYLDNQPDKFTLLGLEYSAQVPFIIEGKNLTLYGKLDRIDEREGNILILDYKSGKNAPIPNKNFWNSDLWDKMENWTPDSAIDPLSEVSENLPSIQLPLYLYLSSHAQNLKKMGTTNNAAWIMLAKGGDEEYLLTDKIPDEERKEICEKKIPMLLRFVFRHLLLSKEFKPHEGKNCENCTFKLLCKN